MIKQVDKSNNPQDSKVYFPARVTVIEFTVQAVLCQSGGINSMFIDEDGGEYFE